MSQEEGPGPLPVSQELTLLKGGLSLTIFSPGSAGDPHSRSGGWESEAGLPRASWGRTAFVKKTPGTRLGCSRAARGQAHPLFPEFKSRRPVWLGSAGPRQSPENRPQPSSQLPCVCFHSCSFCSAVPGSEGIRLRKRMWQRGRRRRPQAARAASQRRSELAKTSQTPRRVTQRPRGQGHGLRGTLHPHPLGGPAPPWPRALPRVPKASARLAA